jgi:hypothetical protein
VRHRGASLRGGHRAQPTTAHTTSAVHTTNATATIT